MTVPETLLQRSWRRAWSEICHAARPATADEALLVDIDLAILGAAEERFAQYEAQIRAEYAWVDDALFRSRRREVLTGFLAPTHGLRHRPFPDPARSDRAVEPGAFDRPPGSPNLTPSAPPEPSLATPLPADVLESLQQGQTIEAIKRLRSATGLGLKEAKEAIDRHLAGEPARPRPSIAAMAALPFAVAAALRKGDRLSAEARRMARRSSVHRPP